MFWQILRCSQPQIWWNASSETEAWAPKLTQLASNARKCLKAKILGTLLLLITKIFLVNFSNCKTNRIYDRTNISLSPYPWCNFRDVQQQVQGVMTLFGVWDEATSALECPDCEGVLRHGSTGCQSHGTMSHLGGEQKLEQPSLNCSKVIYLLMFPIFYLDELMN